MTELETFKDFEAWREKKLAPYVKAFEIAAAAVERAEKELTKAFEAFDVDKTNDDKRNAWFSALKKRNAAIKRRDQYQRVRNEEDKRLTFNLFYEENQ